jgi:hypothetical protein
MARVQEAAIRTEHQATLPRRPNPDQVPAEVSDGYYTFI